MGKNTILVISNNKTTRAILKETLKEEQYRLLFAEDGKTGLSHNMRAGIDMIFVDFKLNGMNGFQTGAQIKDIRPNVTVFLMTRYAKDLQNDEVVLSIIDGLIQQPLNPVEILSTVKWHFKVFNRKNYLQYNNELIAYQDSNL